MFADKCNPSEWLVWARMAGKWIDAAGKAARGDPAKLFRVNALATTWGMLENDGRDCDILDCHEYVNQFAGLATRARAMVVEWGGEGVPEIGAWDVITETGVFPLESIAKALPLIALAVGAAILWGKVK
jgi:hypothetical protein